MPKSPKNPKSSKSKSQKSPKSSKQKDENKDVVFVDPQKENEQKKAKQPITNFFKPLEKPAPPPTVPQCMPDTSRFKSLFQLKQGMKIAPILARKPLSDNERENLLNVECEVSNFLSHCKNNRLKTPALVTGKMKAKYWHFHENYRPPYYGTWRKTSKTITGRRPFSKAEKTLNYDYDSDDDWEEEPADADECKSDEEEEKDVPMNSDDEDDGFFVDHGYLSSDEGSQGGDDLDENDDIERESSKKSKILTEKNEEIDEEGSERSKKSADEKEHEQRRCRLEQKAEEYKAEIRRKERLFKKRQLIPIVYLPDEAVQPEFERFVLPGIRFDYSQIVQKNALVEEAMPLEKVNVD